MQRPRWGLGPVRPTMQGSGPMRPAMQGSGPVALAIQGQGLMRPAMQSTHGSFQPQQVQRFPCPIQQNRFPPPRGPQWHGGFVPRGPCRQRFNGPPQNTVDQFQARNVRPPGQPSSNYGNHQRPQYQGHQGHQGQTFRQRPPFINSHPSKRPNFHQNENQQSFKKAKKPKVDKRDLPENNKFFCDICDRGFKTEEKHREHVDQHQKCTYDGCSYVAAPKLVQLHINLQHRSGLAKKIWSLESPEDIKKWREERKKNYPSAENQAKKQAVMAEKIARGEVIEEKYFGRMHQRGNRKNHKRDHGQGPNQGQSQGHRQGHNQGHNQGHSQGHRQGNNQGQNPERSHFDKGVESTKRKSDSDNQKVVSPNKKIKTVEKELNVQNGHEKGGMDVNKDPLAYFYHAIGSDFDSDSESDGESSTTKPKPVEDSAGDVTAAGALGNLISSYGGSGNDSDNGNVNETTKEEGKQVDGNGPSRTEKTKRRNRNRSRKNKKERKSNAPLQHKVDKSLLEKLLANEIRKERNEILQCVYHIVRHNFFEEKSRVTSLLKTKNNSANIYTGQEVVKSTSDEKLTTDVENHVFADNIRVENVEKGSAVDLQVCESNS